MNLTATNQFLFEFANKKEQICDSHHIFNECYKHQIVVKEVLNAPSCDWHKPSDVTCTLSVMEVLA